MKPRQRAGASGDGTVFENSGFVEPACHYPGTRIATDRGDIPIERLAIGNRVLTLARKYRPIRWIGHRAYAPAFARNNTAIWPVRIAASALSENLPRSDLLVAPNHALFIDGVLIEAACLVNGASKTTTPPNDTLEYFNIEFDSHDVALDPAPMFYVRRVIDGATLAAAKARIDARAGFAPQASGPAGGLARPGTPSRPRRLGDRRGSPGRESGAGNRGRRCRRGAGGGQPVPRRSHPCRRRKRPLQFRGFWERRLDVSVKHVVTVRRLHDGVTLPVAPTLLQAPAPFSALEPCSMTRCPS